MCPLAWPLLLHFFVLNNANRFGTISQQDNQAPAASLEQEDNDISHSQHGSGSCWGPSAAQEAVKPAVAAPPSKLVVHVMASCAVAAMEGCQPLAAPVTPVKPDWAALGKAEAAQVLEVNRLVDEVFCVDVKANHMVSGGVRPASPVLQTAPSGSRP
jgi:hypothetical protein